jgi:hypothetical protein
MLGASLVESLKGRLDECPPRDPSEAPRFLLDAGAAGVEEIDQNRGGRLGISGPPFEKALRRFDTGFPHDGLSRAARSLPVQGKFHEPAGLAVPPHIDVKRGAEAPHKIELGAAWRKTSGTGREYLSVKLDDPSLPAPIYASLVEAEGEGEFTLIWSRRQAE